jgi:bacterioferritin-associated ferredoxin
MYVCVCNAVTDRQIRTAVRGGATTVQALQDELAVGTCCGTCLPCVCEILAETRCREVPAVSTADLGTPLPAFA